MTIPTQLVLRTLLADAARETYGLEICGITGLPSGTVHPILARLVDVGWLESAWEDVIPAKAGRPRRRYYKLTEDGIERARAAMARAGTAISALTGIRHADGNDIASA